MKIRIIKSKYYKNRKEYYLKGIKKCSGFIHYWNISMSATWVSRSYFLVIKQYYCHKSGKQYHDNAKSGMRISKHCKNANEVKKVMELFYKHPIDYVDNI